MRHLPLLLLVASVSTGLVLAAQPVDETRPADADATVEIELVLGRVHIVAWDRNEVRVIGSLGDEVEKLEFESSGGQVTIEVVPLEKDMGRRRKADDTDLEIHVPRGSDLDLETVIAAVTVVGLEGAVSIESVAGPITVEGMLQDVEIETVSGNVEVASRSRLREVGIESVSGNVGLTGELHERAEISVETLSGNVDLRLPRSTSADFEVETFSGDIENDFGPAAERSSQYLPSKTLRFSAGEGSARVEVSSFSGVVRLIAQ